MGKERTSRTIESGSVATDEATTRNLAARTRSHSREEAGSADVRDDRTPRDPPPALDVGQLPGDGPEQLLRAQATCAIPWRAGRYEAIEVFVDPALSDRADGLCAAIEGWSGVHRRFDDLSAEILAYADHEGLSVTIEPQPRDELSTGLVAIAITIG